MDHSELLERIRLRLEESVVGIGDAVAGLPAADVAELVNQLTLHEAASVMALIAVPRAVEVFDQPTLRRRAEIVEELEPARAAQILEGLSSDDGNQYMCEVNDKRMESVFGAARPTPNGLVRLRLARADGG